MAPAESPSASLSGTITTDLPAFALRLELVCICLEWYSFTDHKESACYCSKVVWKERWLQRPGAWSTCSSPSCLTITSATRRYSNSSHLYVDIPLADNVPRARDLRLGSWPLDLAVFILHRRGQVVCWHFWSRSFRRRASSARGRDFALGGHAAGGETRCRYAESRQ